MSGLPSNFLRSAPPWRGDLGGLLEFICSREQITDLDFELLCNPNQVHRCDVSFTSLDAGVVRAIETGIECEGFLAVACIRSKSTDLRTKLSQPFFLLHHSKTLQSRTDGAYGL